jgi:hypothetical protein
MKYPVARFKSLKEALKELEPFVRDARRLETGRPLQKFYGLRPREIWANWLLCAALNFEQEERFTFFSTKNAIGGDGVIHDRLTASTLPTEHVFVPRARGPGAENTAEALIFAAIQKKQHKGGDAYASGKTLVVFSNVEAGPWCPTKIAQRLPETLSFKEVWVVSLQSALEGKYIYGVTCLELSDGNAPIWRVHIENLDAGVVRHCLR